MASSAQTITQSASTRSHADSLHPVAQFLNACHLDMSQFPHLKLTFEINEKRLRTGRIVLPMRIPGDTQSVYHSYARILRVLELPAADQADHRKFIEVEWNIAATPLTEDQYHLAMSFMAQDVICRACHDVFSPDPVVLSDQEVQIECPHCRETWRVILASNASPHSRTPSLLDEHRKDPTLTLKKVRDWHTGQAQVSLLHFPYEFSSWDDHSSLEWMFGSTSNSFSALSNGGLQTFESLMRGFLNDLAKRYLLEGNTTNAQELETTEIQRRNQTQTETRKDLEDTPVPSQLAERKSIRISPPNAQTKATPSAATRSGTSPITRIAASVLFMGIFFGIGWTLVSQFRSVSKPSISESPIRTEALEQNALNRQDPIKEEVITLNVPDPIPAPPENNSEVAPNVEAPKKVVAAVPKSSPSPSPTPDWTQELDMAFRQGMLHLKMQQGEQAITEFKKALALDPRHAESYRGLGLAFVYEQKYAEAIAAFESYLQKSNAKAPDRASVKQLLNTLKERAL